MGTTIDLAAYRDSKTAEITQKEAERIAEATLLLAICRDACIAVDEIGQKLEGLLADRPDRTTLELKKELSAFLALREHALRSLIIVRDLVRALVR